MSITELVVQYHDITTRIKELESQKKNIKAQIDLGLSAIDESRYEDSKYKAVMSASQRVSYDMAALGSELDSLGINKDLYIREEIDLKKIEVLIANGVIRPEFILRHASVKEVKTLKVTKND